MLAEKEDQDKNEIPLYISRMDAHVEDNNGVRFIRVRIKSNPEEIYFHEFTDPSELERFIKKCEAAIDDLKNNVRVYRVNEYITLKLTKSGHTDIYVDGQKFNQCKSLMINIDLENVEDYDEIRSIDEAENLSIKNTHGRYKVDLSPEEEFEGHCSNIQAWVENDYNTTILHRNMAFPLLKRLVEVGDLKARQVFKEEIAYRIGSGEARIIEYLSNKRGYLDELNEEEMDTLEETLPDLFSKLVFRITRGACPDFNYDLNRNEIQKNDLMIGALTEKRAHIPKHFHQQDYTLNELRFKHWMGTRYLRFPMIEDPPWKLAAYSTEDVKIAIKILKKYEDLKIRVPKKGSAGICFLSEQAGIIAVIKPRLFRT